MGLAYGKGHDMATEAKKRQRQVPVKPLETIEEYPENFGLSLLPCNCLFVDPSLLLTLILGKGLYDLVIITYWKIKLSLPRRNNKGRQMCDT